MLNNLMNMINGLEEYDLNEPMDENYINELGFVLLRNDFILEDCGMVIAGMFIANKEMVKRDNVPMIIVDNIFYSLSEDCKKFIIGHELGHLQHERQYEDYVRKIKDEFEADEHAAKLVGIEQSIKALKDLKEALFEMGLEPEDDAAIEIDLRIENLMNK